MQSFDEETQKYLDLGHQCALLAGNWLYSDSTYSKLLLRSHLRIDGNSYYVHSPEEFGILKRLLDSGDLDTRAAEELTSALAHDNQQAITEFKVHYEQHFYSGVVPISRWEEDVLGNNGASITCWGESRFEAMLDGFLTFAQLRLFPYLCWNPGSDPWLNLLFDVLEKLSVIIVEPGDEYLCIVHLDANALGGQEGLRLFCQMASILLRSHLDDLGDERIGQILEWGVRTIWPDLDPLQGQDPAAVATAFLMVGLA